MKTIIIINKAEQMTVHSTHSPLSSSPPLRPPQPHDPSERVCLSEFGDWSLWSIPRNIPEYIDIVRSGGLHMQLFHSGANVSILTPSSLTNNHYELWTPTQRLRVCCYHHVAETLAAYGAPPPPCPGIISRFTAWFLHAPMIGIGIRSMEA